MKPLTTILFHAVLGLNLGICEIQGEETTAPLPSGTVRELSEFGPLGTPQQAQAALARAMEALGKSGGLLIVPASLAGQLRIENTGQGLMRIPPLPEITRSWGSTAGVTVLEAGEKNVTLHVPPLEGMRIARTLRMKEDESLPHWGTHPMVTLENQLIYGSISYLDWLQSPVSAGKDRRFYVPTVRGLRPGQFLNIHAGPGYSNGVLRAQVKSIGYDAEKRQHYLVADTDLEHVAGAIIHNKSNTGILHMTQTSHNDNQTYDVKVIRNQYAHGDTYIYHCDFNYMSNVHSAAGDENGNCYAAFIHSLGDNFRGRVESVEWPRQQLRFTPDSRNVNALGDSRPLINLNPKKWITAGKVWIVPAESYWDTVDTGKYRFQGRSYPSRLVKNPTTGIQEIKMGGLIRGDADCPWTPGIIGRYLAVVEPGELTPGQGNRRWYEVTSLVLNADGTKDIEIRRFWWGAKSAGSPTLYSLERGSWDGHLRPLSYVIAPGTYVDDVSRAIPGGERGGQRTLGLAPYGDQGTAFDFEPGDELEQAIGPDPFKPQAFRVWMWDDVPGAWPAAVFDVANFGEASRYAALVVQGGPSTLDGAAQRQETKPAWDNVLVIESASQVGLNCKGDFEDAAILFQQTGREQPIKWHYGHAEGQPPQEAALSVSKVSGEFSFQGGGLRTNGPVNGVQGISGSTTPANNLRGKNLPVQAGNTTVRVSFPRPEADADYAVFVEQSWLSSRAVRDQTAEGFSVEFDRPAPEGARLHWMIVR
ncbi:MAG: hypothetical protein HYU36_24700 [Planctomycetes bacterium]|nr:hypothetical protein [Planctomycetota bacterium]